MKAFVAVCLAALLTPALVSADTIRLKDGSTIKGKVVKFSNNEFTVQLDTTSSGGGSRALINIDDVESIEFDAAGSKSETTRGSGSPEASTARSTTRTKPASAAKPGEKANPPFDESEGDDDALDSVRPAKSKSGSGNASEIGSIQATDLSVPASGEWTSTGIMLKIGQKVRINSTGEAKFRSRTFGADGLDEPDPEKLLRDANAGVLIAVIGDDNDDFFLIGKSKEFTATRNGRLYLAVNEGATKDYSGGFRCRIEAEIGPPASKRE